MDKSNVSVDFLNKYSFVLLVIGAFLYSFIPILDLPLIWLATFFHEISHGVVALFTGGSINNIKLHFRGSGLCYTTGGINFLITLSGYFGAVLWGALIFNISGIVSKKHIIIILLSIIFLIIGSIIFWVRDLITFIIMAIIVGIFITVLKLKNNSFIKLFLRFTGIFIVIDSIKAPLSLIDGRGYGDGNKLSEMTMIPEIIWVLVWFIFGLLALYYLWKRSVKHI